MQLKTYILLGPCVACLFNFVNVEALTGKGVRFAMFSEYRFVVSVTSMIGDEFSPGLDLMCTGTLVTQKDVITAADCLQNRPIHQVQVFAGSIHLHDCERYNAEWWVSYDIWAMHKSLQVENPGHNIAILRLSQDVNNITPAIIVPIQKNLLSGVEVETTGWAHPQNTQSITTRKIAKFKILSDDVCKERIRKLDADTKIIDNSILCTAASPNVILNLGDFGGPVLMGNRIIAINKGTYPSTARDTNPDKVNIHYNAAFYTDFIIDAVKNYN